MNAGLSCAEFGMTEECSCVELGRSEKFSCVGESGGKCRFPERARLSLEAIGFDVEGTLAEFFNVRLDWAENGTTPKHYTLLSALALDKFVV